MRELMGVRSWGAEGPLFVASRGTGEIPSYNY